MLFRPRRISPLAERNLIKMGSMDYPPEFTLGYDRGRTMTKKEKKSNLDPVSRHGMTEEAGL